EGVKVFFKAVLEGKPWTRDPYSPRLPGNEDLYQLNEHNEGKNLVFGFLWNDTNTMPHPPIKRAMEIAKQALLAEGHKGFGSLFSLSRPNFYTVVDWSGEGHPD